MTPEEIQRLIEDVETMHFPSRPEEEIPDDKIKAYDLGCQDCKRDVIELIRHFGELRD